MGYVQFGMLGALGALAIPIVIHLMFRRQARPVDLGTLQFLRVVLRDNSKKRRLKRYLLLALRMAAVALIAFLFARPYLLATEPVEGSRLVVILVDRSASMGLRGGTRPIDRAADEVRAIVAKAGRGTQLEVASFDSAVHPFPKATEPPKGAFEPSGTGTDYGAALAWGRDLLVRSNRAGKKLHILTDLQRSGLDRGESPLIPRGVEVHLSDLGRAFPKNVAVVGLTASPEAPRPRESATLTAAVRNLSPLPVAKVPVRLHLYGPGQTAIDLEKTIDLGGSATATIDFTLSDLVEGLWRGHVEAKTADDDLPFDDRRYVALPVAPSTRVLLINGDPGRSPFEAETYFLKAALRLAPEGESYAKAPFDPRTIDVSGASRSLPDLSKSAAVVLANVGDLSTAEARALADYVGRGGGLLVFTGDRVTANGSATLVAAGLGVGKLVGPESALERPFRLDSWEESHPIFRPFANPESGDLRRPAFSTFTRIVPDSSARVLATFRGGAPALLEKAVGRGKVLWFATACDRDWGDWPRGRMYLPLVSQMLAHASGLSEGGRVRQELAGARAPGLSEADGIVRVVNADPYESETGRCTPKEFADRFGFTPVAPGAAASRSDNHRKPADDRLRGDEIWPWLALTLVGVLMLENFLANRTAA